jgi:nitroreductase
MDFFDAVSRRRSIRNYSDRPVPPDVIQKAIDAALLAPNSSNMQTWDIYWVRSPEKKRALAVACMDQGAARTAQELLVVTANPAKWRAMRDANLAHVRTMNRQDMIDYYSKLMPFLYGYQWLAPLKWILFNVMGVFRPVPREVVSWRDRRETAVKSAALACENFMLAIAAQGFDTCPMEGLDSSRVRRVIGFPRSATVVMAISVGERTDRGIWGERFRVPREQTVHEI